MNITIIDSTFFDSVKRRIVKVLRFGKTDTNTGFEVSPFGIDSNPLPGMRAIFADTNRSGRRIIVGYLNHDQLAAPGESRMFSVDSDGNLKAFIWLKNDGTIQLNGSGNHVAQYEGLKKAFDQLKNDFNNHMHSSNGTPPTVPSQADISGAEIQNILTP